MTGLQLPKNKMESYMKPFNFKVAEQKTSQI